MTTISALVATALISNVPALRKRFTLLLISVVTVTTPPVTVIVKPILISNPVLKFTIPPLMQAVPQGFSVAPPELKSAVPPLTQMGS